MPLISGDNGMTILNIWFSQTCAHLHNAFSSQQHSPDSNRSPGVAFVLLQTVLRLGSPISQLAYVEVHLSVTETGHVFCQLVRRSQHSRALQALGLQKDATSPLDTDPQDDPSDDTSTRRVIRIPSEGPAHLQLHPSQATRRHTTDMSSQADAQHAVCLQAKPRPAATAEPQSATQPEGTATVPGPLQQGGTLPEGVLTEAGPGLVQQSAAKTISPALSTGTLPVGSSPLNQEALALIASGASMGHSPAALASSQDWPAETPAGASAPVADRSPCQSPPVICCMALVQWQQSLLHCFFCVCFWYALYSSLDI